MRTNRFTIPDVTVWVCIVASLSLTAAIGLTGCVAGPPQSVNIYTDPIDPNRPMYKFLSKPSDSWVKAFGDDNGDISERAVISYQLAIARQQRGKLRQMIVDVNNSIVELTDTQLWLMKVIGRDPNSN